MKGSVASGMTPKFDVLCVGFSCTDLVIPYSGLPVYDRKRQVHGLRFHGGGPAATAAIALRRLGLKTALVTALGDDEWGRVSKSSLERERVELFGPVSQKGVRSPLSVILADPDGGARTILWNRGTLAPPSPKDVRRCFDGVKLVLIDELYPKAALEAVLVAEALGIPVVFDAGTAAPELEELVKRVTVLAASQHFPQGMTGISQPRQALEALFRMNGRPVISTRGKDGCWLLDERGLRTFPAPVVAAVDTTGAGDAFHAALAFAFYMAWPLEKCLEFANFYGAQNCCALGARGRLLGLEEVEEWLHAHLPVPSQPVRRS